MIDRKCIRDGAAMALRVPQHVEGPIRQAEVNVVQKAGFDARIQPRGGHDIREPPSHR
jgi:hypothetical protein